MMVENDLRELILYLVRSLQEQGGSPTRIRLHKLLYLADLEALSRRHVTMTGVDWLFHHYGPWSPAVHDVLKTEAETGALEEREIPYRRGKSFVYYAPTDVGVKVETWHARILDHVAKEWGLLGLEQLLDYVYFDTPPMRDARRGERLDLEKALAAAEPGAEPESGPPRQLTKEELTKLRERAEEMRQRFKRFPRVRFRPAPFDEIYEEAIDLMDAEEGWGLEVRPLDHLRSDDEPELRGQVE